MIDYKAVIFDLDGTLINSLEDIADSVNTMLIECGYSTYSYAEYKLFVGNGFRNLVNRCLPENKRDESNLLRCYSIAMKIYEEKCVNKSYVYDGIVELIDFLTDQGITLAILSNKPDELTQKTTKELLKKWKFEIIMGATERFPRKPDPSSALYIADVINVKPCNILYIGDSDVDMKTANAAGFYAIGVTWGFRPRTELEVNGAKLIIDHPLELVEKINE